MLNQGGLKAMKIKLQTYDVVTYFVRLIKPPLIFFCGLKFKGEKYEFI